jgi:hypothetical protein
MYFSIRDPFVSFRYPFGILSVSIRFRSYSFVSFDTNVCLSSSLLSIRILSVSVRYPFVSFPERIRTENRFYAKRPKFVRYPFGVRSIIIERIRYPFGIRSIMIERIPNGFGNPFVSVRIRSVSIRSRSNGYRTDSEIHSYPFGILSVSVRIRSSSLKFN